MKLNTRRRALARIPYAKIRRRAKWRELQVLLGQRLISFDEASAIVAHKTIVRVGLPTQFWRAMASPGTYP